MNAETKRISARAPVHPAMSPTKPARDMSARRARHESVAGFRSAFIETICVRVIVTSCRERDRLWEQAPRMGLNAGWGESHIDLLTIIEPKLSLASVVARHSRYSVGSGQSPDD
jgi:hypothetical protein